MMMMYYRDVPMVVFITDIVDGGGDFEFVYVAHALWDG